MKNYFVIFMLHCLVAVCFATEAPFIEQPRPQELSLTEKKMLLFYLEHIGGLSPDHYYRIARFYIQTGALDQAKKNLKAALSLDSHFIPAYIQLGFVDIWQKDFEEGYSLFSHVLQELPCEKSSLLGLKIIAFDWTARGKNRLQALKITETLDKCHPQKREDLYDLGILYLRLHEWKSAERCFKELLDLDRSNIEARKAFAQSLALQLKYKEAKKEYAFLPKNDSLWLQSMDIKSHTNLGIVEDFFYVDSKENDPTLKVPVVKDYYFYSGLNFLIPIFDRWRLDAKQLYYHQRENNIYHPSVNYTMYLSGGQLTSHYFFAENWKWDLYGRSFRAWGSQDATFPFVNTTRFEPGTLLLYHSEQNLFLFDAHTESFVIKNFFNLRSQILKWNTVDTAYEFRPDLPLSPSVFIGAGWIFYRDPIHNQENREDLWLKCGIPFLSKYLTAIYHFEHSGFKYLTPNYFSYKNQWLNVIGGRLYFESKSRAFLEINYEHTMQLSYNLIQPIGTFLFIAKQQYLIGNRIAGKVGYRYKDKLQVNLEGHFTQNNLPYRDWGVRGSIYGQF